MGDRVSIWEKKSSFFPCWQSKLFRVAGGRGQASERVAMRRRGQRRLTEPLSHCSLPHSSSPGPLAIVPHKMASANPLPV